MEKKEKKKKRKKEKKKKTELRMQFYPRPLMQEEINY